MSQSTQPYWQTYNLLPRALALSVVATGGTAVVAITGPISGGYIANPPNAASQGTGATGNGTTSVLGNGASFTLPALAAGVTVKVNAATSGHKFTGTVW